MEVQGEFQGLLAAISQAREPPTRATAAARLGRPLMNDGNRSESMDRSD